MLFFCAFYLSKNTETSQFPKNIKIHGLLLAKICGNAVCGILLQSLFNEMKKCILLFFVY